MAEKLKKEKQQVLQVLQRSVLHLKQPQLKERDDGDPHDTEADSGPALRRVYTGQNMMSTEAETTVALRYHRAVEHFGQAAVELLVGSAGGQWQFWDVQAPCRNWRTCVAPRYTLFSCCSQSSPPWCPF